MAMHVPDFDFTKATKPRATCPWGDDLGVLNDFQTTYNQHFRHYPSARLAPIKPSPAMSWAGGAVGYNIKSTTQDSFQPPSIAFKQLPSCKPKLVFTSVPHQAPISSTSQTAFVRYGPGVEQHHARLVLRLGRRRTWHAPARPRQQAHGCAPPCSHPPV